MDDIDSYISEKSKKMSEVMREKHASDPVYHERVCNHLATCNSRKSKEAKYKQERELAIAQDTYTERMKLKDEVLSDNLAKGRIIHFLDAVDKDKMVYLTKDITEICNWLHTQPFTRDTEMKLNILRDTAKRRVDYFLCNHCISSAPPLCIPKEN